MLGPSSAARSKQQPASHGMTTGSASDNSATIRLTAAIPSGTGRPGTAQVRALKPAATYGAGYTTSATLTSDTAGVVYSPLAQFTRLCNYPAGSATASFRCGNG